MTTSRSPSRRARFTKAFLQSLKPPLHGRDYWHDTAVPGLLAQVTNKGAISFAIQRRVNGKPVRVTLGRFPPMTIESARRLAHEHLARMAEGINPNFEKRECKARALTLSETLQDYLDTKPLKPKTKALYQWLVEDQAGAFADWKDFPLIAITRDQVERRHRQLMERSPGIAELACNVLSALFNFARSKYEIAGKPLVEDNPVRRLAATGARRTLPRRRGYIKPAKMRAWWQATEALDPTPRDLLRLLLLTGLRKNEGASLRWDNIDLIEGTLHVPETKNSRPLTLPLSDWLSAMLADRANNTDRLGTSYVFPSTTGRGHFTGALSACHRVAEVADTSRMAHDLRRTFLTTAERLGVPGYSLKALVNHYSSVDTTQGYLQIDTERLRAPMQQIADFILKASGVKDSADVVDLPTVLEVPKKAPLKGHR